MRRGAGYKLSGWALVITSPQIFGLYFPLL